MANEQLNTNETYTLGWQQRGTKISLVAAGAAAGLYVVQRTLGWYFGSRRRSPKVELPEDPEMDLSDVGLPEGVITNAGKHPSFGLSRPEVQRRLLEHRATRPLREIPDVQRFPRAVALLGTEPDTFSRARQELGLKDGEGIEAVCYQDQEGKWSDGIAVTDGFQVIESKTRGVIRGGNREKVLAAAIIPEEFGSGRMALCIRASAGLVALQTHVADVLSPEAFAIAHPEMRIIHETGMAA